MGIELGFYKINKEYTDFLIGQDLDIVDKLVEPCVYFGPVFEKESANGKKMKFYIPCCPPTKKDFASDIIQFPNNKNKKEFNNYDLHIDWDNKVPIENPYSCRYPLFCDSWVAKGDCNIALMLKLADMIPVPDNMIEEYDLWNDVKISKDKSPEEANKQHKAMYARFKCVQDDILNNPLNLSFVIDDCFEFYEKQIRFNIGDYDPYRVYTASVAGIEEKGLKMGIKGDMAETAYLIFESKEYKQNKEIFNDKNSVKMKLMKNKIHDDVISVAKEMKNKSKKEKQISSALIETDISINV